jgi:hypothetical protein
MKKFFIPCLPVLFFAVIVSCESTQQPVEPVEPSRLVDSPAETPPPVDRSSADAAKTRADAARQRAGDFQAPVYAPEEWENAGNLYTRADGLPRNSAGEVRQAVSAYDEAAAAYDGAFRTAVPLYFRDRSLEINDARNELIATGLADQFSEYLAVADGIAAGAVEQYDREDYYAARDTAAQALLTYRGMKTGADAWLVRTEISDRGFSRYDPDNFDKADAAGLAAIDSYEAGNLQQASDEAEEAKLRYNLVLKTGWISFAGEKKDAAGEERQRALDLKANIAVRADFNAAAQIFGQAETSLKAERFEEAAGLYTQSEAGFVNSSRLAEEKRVIAEEAIRAAEEKMIESDENAQKAELILEGGI